VEVNLRISTKNVGTASTPKMKARDVITMGRSRSRAACSTASMALRQ
jgi:hypothetical protein